MKAFIYLKKNSKLVNTISNVLTVELNTENDLIIQWYNKENKSLYSEMYERKTYKVVIYQN